MKRIELLALIKEHLEKTGEPPYSWGQRVMNDKAFLWKVEHQDRMPYPRTVKKILRAIRFREVGLERRQANKAKGAKK